MSYCEKPNLNLDSVVSVNSARFLFLLLFNLKWPCSAVTHFNTVTMELFWISHSELKLWERIYINYISSIFFRLYFSLIFNSAYCKNLHFYLHPLNIEELCFDLSFNFVQQSQLTVNLYLQIDNPLPQLFSQRGVSVIITWKRMTTSATSVTPSKVQLFHCFLNKK